MSRGNMSLLEENPFFHRGAIRDQVYFLGRGHETREILGAVSKGQCLSITGPWHIGKTSLLFHVADRQVLAEHGLEPDRFVMVYCTGQELRDDDQSDLLGYLQRKTKSRLTSDVECQRFDELVGELACKGLTTVLLLDEFELFATNPGATEGFFQNLCALQSEHVLTFVTSSRISLRELSLLDGSLLPANFFQMFQLLNLGLFRPEEAISLITELSQRGGIAFSRHTVEFILDVAGLHPFFLQVACDYVFECQSTKSHLDAPDYDRLRQEISSELKGHFAYYWDILDVTQQSILVNLEIAQAIPDNTQQLRELARQGLIVRKDQAYDYVSSSFKEFVEKLSNPVFEQTRQFFTQAGFLVKRIGVGSGEFAVTTSKWVSHSKYGDILVRVLTGDLDADHLIEVERRIKAIDVSREIAYAVYGRELLNDAFWQMFTYKSKGLTIVPLNASVICDALLSTENCYGRLKALEAGYLGRANLYEWSNAIQDPTWFFGRRQEADAIIARLESLQHAGIFGMRKIGKTSLLFQLKQRLRSKSVPIAYLGLQGSTADPLQLLTDIVRQIHSCIRVLGVKEVPNCKLLTSPPGEATGQMFREDMLALWEVARGELRVPFMVVMMDEVERLVPSSRSYLVSYEKYDTFFASIRDLSQIERCLVSVVTGERPTIRKEFDTEKQPLSNAMFELYDERYLQNLAFDDCRDMVVRIGKGMDVDYSDESVKAIFGITAGHPYITRILCACLVADLKTSQVSVKDVEQAVPKSLDRLHEYFAGWCRNLTKAEVQLVDSILANHAVPEKMTERHKEALRHLQKQGIIHEAQAGQWDITIQLLRRWLRHRKGV